ncbi:MAG: multidrug effflux MFS transporter [Actinomycetota bacterium]|nr:multidrug effflux MFS transporter [Actinomycetota bacterium]
MTTIAHPGDALSRGQRVVYIVALGLLVALGPFTIDLYLPAFPSVARELSAPDAAVQLTLTATSIGFAVGQLVVGPWSDRIGRRTPLLIATAVHIAASLGVAIAPNVEVLTLFRIVQGIGAAGGGVVALAVVRDLFGGQPLIRMLSRLALVTGLAPILAPVIGSQLLLVVDWRGIFVALAAYGALVLAIAALLITETLPPERRGVTGHNTMRARYRALYTDRVFVGLALIGGMVFSALFVYLSSSSFLFQTIYGFNAQQFGLLFGVNSIGLAIASQTSSRAMRRIAPQWVLAAAITIMLISVILIGIFQLLGFGLISVVVPLFFAIASFGLGFPSIQVLALAHHGQEAGTAASLLGAVNAGLAGIISPIVGVIGITSALPMAVVMSVVLVVAQFVLWVIVRPRSVPSIGY